VKIQGRQLLFLLPVLGLLGSLPGSSLPSREEVLGAIFPRSTIRAERVFLTGQQQRQAVALSGGEVPTALIARYVAWQGDKEIGRAYVDTHVVRTKKESLLICLDEKGFVSRIEVTAFLEPQEYRVSDRWYEQYEGKTLSRDLNIQRSIRPIAGATLTARATNEAVRRVLAIDRVLRAAEEEKP
jgi:Na+-translocating ferredoxin:NAD+ oxidoreductase subunit G